ncbi:hypothetical protein IEO21_04091 [Rhodonia placenta]|uniref:Uncharacterized protein n=1 Tax=Rhodonia placenta TaxID=104341 RepID=A0A8H7P4V4_9APHY|nr:hypothetical protein IEO21_04091 [Postia placenta]
MSVATSCTFLAMSVISTRPAAALRSVSMQKPALKISLLIYHVTLNLPHDVRRLWGRRSIATLLSAINWLAITASIMTNMPLPSNTIQVWGNHSIIHPSRCASYNHAYAVVFLVNSSISPLVAALRVHAVSGRNWCWILPVWLFGMVPMGTNIWLLTRETFLIIIPQLGCESSLSASNATYPVYADSIPTPDVAVVMSRGSVVVSDILVVVATWYYISRTSSVRTKLVRDMWAARPNLTTVMFRDGTLYFLIISLLNIVDLIMIVITVSSSFYVLDITGLTTAMSSILISHFLICIREAAERSTHIFGSQSLSFVDSQGSVSPQPWLSSVEFTSDIGNRSAENGHADAFSDLDDNGDNLDSECGEEELEVHGENENGIGREELTSSGQ